MKRLFTTLVLICIICSVSFAKDNIALFVYGDIDSGDKFIIESKVSEQVSANRSFDFLTRSQVFLDMLTEEKVFQHSGEVSNAQMCTLGEMWGAKYIIGIMAVETRGQLMLTAKLINTATGKEAFSISNYKAINNGNDIIYLSTLLGSNIKKKLRTNIK